MLIPKNKVKFMLALNLYRVNRGQSLVIFGTFFKVCIFSNNSSFDLFVLVCPSIEPAWTKLSKNGLICLFWMLTCVRFEDMCKIGIS